MNSFTRFVPTVEIPESILAAHPNCYVLAEHRGKMAIVDPDIKPKPDGVDVAYLHLANHSYISPFIRVMGKIVLYNRGITLLEKDVTIAGSVIWFGLAKEMFNPKTLQRAVGSTGRPKLTTV